MGHRSVEGKAKAPQPGMSKRVEGRRACPTGNLSVSERVFPRISVAEAVVSPSRNQRWSWKSRRVHTTLLAAELT